MELGTQLYCILKNRKIIRTLLHQGGLVHNFIVCTQKAIMSTIGQRIRTIRKTNNLNPIKFANIIGISQGTLSELEQDKYRPSLDIIIAIKENFNSHLIFSILRSE
ncbi:helix-turn-helix domain-containing protein [Paenibacillus polymyxa]|uniref:helix-turn-helix domain-containing protein n=1 Tax=Paenibacillus polymyxa TaxID=1406 RepID=UPI0027D78C0A|nr:helix-turn-helix transcriptional regulator [Paenibacillus polymyxa]